MKFCINKNSRGVTLLELLVAIAIFAVVITLVVTLFTTALKGQRRAVALQNVQDNARFLLDFMVKELRMSTINSASQDSLDITRSDGVEVTYLFSGGDLQRTVAGDAASSGTINSQEVIVTGNFFVTGITGGPGGDNLQPKITIVLKVETSGEKGEEKAAINVQATLSQRVVDI